MLGIQWDHCDTSEGAAVGLFSKSILPAVPNEFLASPRILRITGSSAGLRHLAPPVPQMIDASLGRHLWTIAPP
ncbi:unnamed protein product [Nezara viridula]|uniref:Uncharacterized protein n=1 Tax=Nezara viridula TaxID=85310 RepID=A0A9P0HAU9_NEZVI|nr:unnamed protein product [Nezara viridula]